MLFAILAGLTGSVLAQEKPPAGYQNWGVCPFECCEYREWTADADIPVHKTRNDKSPVIFRLHRREKVQALDGVVVTERPVAVHIDQPVKDGYVGVGGAEQLDLKAGDTIYMLTPLGEGFYLFWYQGKVYHSGLPLAGMPGVDGAGLKVTWWKLLRNNRGQQGWTRSNAFSNADACG